MENNEIVRSLKFYCDAIFKYDYEKDKVFSTMIQIAPSTQTTGLIPSG